jgi:hypothetical protein
MKAVLSEADIRESIRKALIKSLMLEGEEEAEAVKSFDDKIADLGRKLREDTVKEIKISSLYFTFEETAPVAGYMQNDAVYSSARGASVEKVQNNPDFRQALTDIIEDSDTIDRLFRELNENDLSKTFAVSLRGGGDNSPVGMLFIVGTTTKRILEIHYFFSPKTIANFIVGARQQGQNATLGDGEAFPEEIEKMIAELAPRKDKSK